MTEKNLRQVPHFPDVLRTASASRALIRRKIETQKVPKNTSNLPPIAPAYIYHSRPQQYSQSNVFRLPTIDSKRTSHPTTSTTSATPHRSQLTPIKRLLVRQGAQSQGDIFETSKEGIHSLSQIANIQFRRAGTLPATAREHESPVFRFRVR